MFSGTVFTENCRKFQKYLWREVSAVYDDPKRYENDGLYEDEDTEYEDEYETDDSDYIVDDEDEEDENALWDDEDAADAEIDDPPDKPRRKQKKKDIEDSSDENYPEEAEAESAEQAQRQIALEQNIIDRLEADAEEHPFEDDAGDEEPERKKLKRELRAQALKRLEDSARTLKDYENLVAWYDRLDANRQRRERYHELFRSGLLQR